MDALSAIKVPDDPGPFKRAEDRWKPYLDDPETASVFAGPVLTHSDWTPDNVLVSRAPRLADRLGLADPRRRLDRPGLLGAAPHGIRRPHRAEAERQASRLPAFQAADPAHIDLFAAANVRLWDEIAQENERLDDEDGTSRTRSMGRPPAIAGCAVRRRGADRRVRGSRLWILS